MSIAGEHYRVNGETSIRTESPAALAAEICLNRAREAVDSGLGFADASVFLKAEDEQLLASYVDCQSLWRQLGSGYFQTGVWGRRADYHQAEAELLAGCFSRYGWIGPTASRILSEMRRIRQEELAAAMSRLLAGLVNDCQASDAGLGGLVYGRAIRQRLRHRWQADVFVDKPVEDYLRDWTRIVISRHQPPGWPRCLPVTEFPPGLMELADR